MFEQFNIYSEKRVPQKSLVTEINTLLDYLDNLDKIWIIKISGSLFVPSQGDLITFWPSGDEGRDLINQYCNMVESANMILPKLVVNVQIGLYLENLEGLNQSKYQELFKLLKEFGLQQEMLQSQSS